MRKFSRTLLAFLLIMVGALMAACGKGPDDVNDATSKIKWDVDLSNPITINAMFPAAGISGFGADDTAKIIEATTGYKTKYSELSEANADNDVSNIFLNQEKYHIIKLTEAQYHPNAKEGTLLDLTTLLQNTEQGRMLYALIDLMDYGWDAVTYEKEDGTKGIYAVPDFGYCVMEDSAFVWNVDHLKQIGYVNEDGSVKIPSTIGEFSDALVKLQTKYGASNDSYRALTIPGSNWSNINTLMSAFDVPNSYYVDENGNIQMYIFHEGVTKYVNYMHDLRNKGVISKNWQNTDQANCIASFANGNSSVTMIAYWWVESLINSVVAKGNLAKDAGVTNDYQTVHDQVICWATRLRGDGTNGSVNQEKARYIGGEAGVSYYTGIPYYMAEDAVYIIDYLAKKMLYFAEYYGGTGLSKEEISAGKTNAGVTIDENYIKNNVHWVEVDAPAGANAFYDKDDYGYQQYEDYTNKIIYLRPYSYEIEYKIDSKLSHPVADGETKVIKSNCQEITYHLVGDTMHLSVQGGGRWVQLTSRYMEQIVDNSQYCNGTNSIAANVLFHLRETGFDAWQVTVPMDDSIITCPMEMMPPMKYWAPISILSRTVAKRGIASAIDCPDSTTPEKALNLTRQSLYEKYSKGLDGTKYYYWSDDIVNEMTTWYKNVKLKRDEK
ncbi:MAG: hypothetical protein J6X93_05895 [Bacilli bacterium]|nr:hypothetical protein [Bacilli bacterium]